jgi:hypothetical protein
LPTWDDGLLTRQEIHKQIELSSKWDEIVANGKNLNSMQKRFIVEYVLNDGQGTAAARAAGYKNINAGNVACELLAKPRIKEMVKELRALQKKKLEEHLDVTFDWKLRKLKFVMQQGLPEEEGQEIDPELAAIGLRAMELANKMQGHNAPEKHATLNLHADADMKMVSNITQLYLKEY